MKLSIIIPAHNEAVTIKQVLEKVSALNIAPWEKEIIVVNDGSSDNTGKIIEQWASLQGKNAHCLHHAKNLGKGAGIQTGLKQASGDYIVIQDADAEYDPFDIPNLLGALSSSKINSNLSPALPKLSAPFLPSRQMGGSSEERANNELAIFGARGNKAYPERGFHYVIGAWLLTNSFNLLFRQKLTDLYTGYKLIPSTIFKQLQIESRGFEFEAEVACKLALRGVRIKEIPITYKPRNKNQGKHIGFFDAWKGFWAIGKYWGRN